jgi:glycosyltransferase involved in cell wall biosynthesis
MKILLIHSAYRLRGGEDSVLAAEGQLLRAAGHTVIEYLRDNSEISGYSTLKRAILAPRSVWAWDSYRQIKALLARERPDLAHFHNTFPLISPSAYYACREAGVPVIQSLHNPRLLCPAATLQRDHRACQDCMGKTFAWPAVLHGCYRGSRTQTGIVAAMLAIHWQFKTWERAVDRYVVFSEFYRRKFIEAGLPAEKIVVKPHFVEDRGVRHTDGRYALFVGRLATEKGVDTLLEAWKGLRHIPLMIRGDGQLLPRVQAFARETGGTVQILPRLDRDELAELMQGARFLVWPSEGYYETFGLVAAEAFSCGVPVLASRTGVMKEIVAEGRTGLHFTPADPADLAAKAEWAWDHPKEMEVLGRHARKEYETKYTAARNYELLMDIYRQVLPGESDYSREQTTKKKNWELVARSHNAPILSSGVHLNSSSTDVLGPSKS